MDGIIENVKGQFDNAFTSFEEGAKEGNQECMFKCAKMLFLGKGCNKDDQKATQYLSQSKDQGYSKSDHFLTALKTMNNFKEFIKLPTDAQIVFISNIIKNLNQGEDMFKKIVIKSNKAEQLFYNKSLKSTNFHKCIKIFTEIIIEVEYPSKIFKRIIDLVSKIKLQNDHIITIGVVFKSFQETMNKYCFSQNISYHTIDNSFYFLPEYAFCGCDLLERFIIPTPTISIGKYAFSDCSSLTQIIISSSVSEIKDNAFQNCINLAEIIIPPSVVIIGNEAFSKCSKLTKIIIPSSVTSIGNKAFINCSSLKQVSLSSNLTEIRESLFEKCINLDQITIPSSVITIGNKAFYECTSLTQISIPSSVNEIKECAFKKCINLDQIIIPQSVSLIGNECFSECSKLREIIIPPSVNFIGNKAFSGCLELEQASLPSSETKYNNSIIYYFN